MRENVKIYILNKKYFLVNTKKILLKQFIGSKKFKNANA